MLPTSERVKPQRRCTNQHALKKISCLNPIAVVGVFEYEYSVRACGCLYTWGLLKLWFYTFNLPCIYVCIENVRGWRALNVATATKSYTYACTCTCRGLQTGPPPASTRGDMLRSKTGSYKRVKGRSHPVEKRISMHPHKPHATSQPSRFSHTQTQHRLTTQPA